MSLDLTVAVEAAARAWYDDGRPPGAAPYDAIDRLIRHRVMESILPAVAAATPLIEAAVREQVAREVAEMSTVVLTHYRSGKHGYRLDATGVVEDIAARIASGVTS